MEKKSSYFHILLPSLRDEQNPPIKIIAMNSRLQ